MTENWRHLHVYLMCMDFTEPRTSKIHLPEPGEWNAWAVSIYRKAVVKANGKTGKGPLYVCSWLAMRAASYEWEDLFEFWGRKAHDAGEVSREMVDSRLFKEMSRNLALEERIAIGRNRFHKNYEEAFGYPVSASPLAQAQHEEEIDRCESLLE